MIACFDWRGIYLETGPGVTPAPLSSFGLRAGTLGAWSIPVVLLVLSSADGQVWRPTARVLRPTVEVMTCIHTLVSGRSPPSLGVRLGWTCFLLETGCGCGVAFIASGAVALNGVPEKDMSSRGRKQ